MFFSLAVHFFFFNFFFEELSLPSFFFSSSSDDQGETNQALCDLHGSMPSIRDCHKWYKEHKTENLQM